MIGFDIKSKIERNVKNATTEFMKREDISTEFGQPVLYYVKAKHPLFDMFSERELSVHPKSIYQPGNTLVLYYIPFPKDVAESNKGGDKTSPQWERAFTESIWLAMTLNRVIRETLDTIGRLSSPINTPTDWDEELCHENWSHKLAAFAAGMGELGPAGSFHTKDGYGGRISGILTDGQYADDFEEMTSSQLDEIYDMLMTKCCYEGASNVHCSEEMIKACPGNAISENGIDRKKCQAHCKTIDKYIPSPDVCGKCFMFK